MGLFINILEIITMKILNGNEMIMNPSFDEMLKG